MADARYSIDDGCDDTDGGRSKGRMMSGGENRA